MTFLQSIRNNKTTMFGGSSGFHASKLRVHLKMAVGRCEMLKNKKTALIKQNMRQIALMLAEEPPKEEKAKIRAEALVRDDNYIEALEILQLSCELLQERIKLVEFSKECPSDLVSVVSTIIWASHRVEIPELVLARKQLTAKFGKNFEDYAMKNTHGCLNERVVTKLSVEPPPAYLVQVYLEKICDLYDVEWKPVNQLSSTEMSQPVQAPKGYSVPVAQGTGLGPKLGVTATAAETADEMNSIPRTNTSDNNSTTATVLSSFRGYFHNKANVSNGSLMAATGASSKSLNQRGGILPSTGVSTKSLYSICPPTAPNAGEQYNGHDSDYQEVDIFVPKYPPASAPPGSVRGGFLSVYDDELRSKMNSDKRDDNNDDDDDDNTTLSSKSAMNKTAKTNNTQRDGYQSGMTYDELAKRFNQLSK